MKKVSYNQKSKEELTVELATLRSALRAMTIKAVQGKNTPLYRTTRKNVARVLTAINTQAESRQSTKNK